MPSIRLISTTTVQAATHDESTRRIGLTPWDLQFLRVSTIQKGLLFHKPPQEPEPENTIICHLKICLSRTLDLFPPLAGRLAFIEHGDDTASFFIDCNNAGAQFVHAAADGVTVADVIKPAYVPEIIRSFFPLNGVLNCEGISKPLLAVQVTELEDAIFMGCTINHCVADGTSFWHFFNSWSEISRGLDQTLSKPTPFLKRWFPNGTDCSIRIPLSHVPQNLDRFVPPPLKERVFHFSKENIAKLKIKANSDIGSTGRISSLQALLSHLWRSSIRSRCLSPDQETRLNIAIGIRPRLQPPLPEGYFGNASQFGIVALKASDLLDSGLGYVAWEINKVVAMHTDDKFRNLLGSWIENPKPLTMGMLLSGNAISISSSPRFNVYGNDFGWGKPIAVRSGVANKYDGKITLFPGVEEGSVDIEACLSPQTLEGMGNDAEFMDAVTIKS